MNNQFSLATDAFICVDGEHVILLDLASDKYLSMPRAQAAHLQGAVRGWPVSGPIGTDASRDEVLQELVGRGLLTGDGHRGKSAAPLDLAMPTRECVPDIEDTRARIGMMDAYRFAQSTVAVALTLRLLPLAKVIDRLRRRDDAARSINAVTEISMREVVSIFVHLRVSLVTTKDTCLADAIALKALLAQYGYRASLVFGVRGAPFHAHCWLQHRDVVINDTIESVARFKPIMVV